MRHPLTGETIASFSEHLCRRCGGTEVAELLYPPIPRLCPACGERALATTRNWLM